MMQIHPFANTFPLLDGAEYFKLLESIRNEGQIEPIITYRGALIDGRNRLRACKALGVEPFTRELIGEFNDDALRHIIVALNVCRRHLTVAQRAAYWAQMVNISHGGDRRSETIKAPMGGLISIEQAADLSGVSERTIERATFIKKHDPEMFQALSEGQTTVREAEAVVKRSLAEVQESRDVGARLEAHRQERNQAFFQRKDEAIKTVQSRRCIPHTCPACGHAHEVKLDESMFNLFIKPA